MSLSRHYCKLCNVWIKDDKLNIQKHEGGYKHKMALEAFLKQTHRKAADKEKEDAQTMKELNKINQAAELAYEQDLAIRFGSKGASASGEGDVSVNSRATTQAHAHA